MSRVGKMEFDSNNINMHEFVQEANLTVAQVPMMHTALLAYVSLREKSKKLNGLNFKLWQQKNVFYFTILNLARFLMEDTPKLKEDKLDIQVINVVDA